MQCGYPRFFVHPIIQDLAKEVVSRHGRPETETAMLFPSPKTARTCYSFFLSRLPGTESQKVRQVDLAPPSHTDTDSPTVTSPLSGVIFPKEHGPIAKQVWQHTGSGISSRRGEFCLDALRDGFLQEKKDLGLEPTSQRICKGPRRYQGKDSVTELVRGTGSQPLTPNPAVPTSGSQEGREYAQFIEERFGRNLNISLSQQAKVAVRKRIAGVLTANVDLSEALEKTGEGRMAGLSESDVYIFPTGMNAIFNAHQMLLSARGAMKSVCFGFPYIDTLKTLEKWGPGCLFYGHGSSEDLDDLESRLDSGERFLALFTEFPGNPLLKSPDLRRIRALADKYDFAVVVDETVGNFININVLPYADVVVSSLTKIFSGDSNVMGGSAVLNPHARYYRSLKETFSREYEDNLWAEDAVFLERNSRDFVSRIEKINQTTDEITEMLRTSSLGKSVLLLLPSVGSKSNVCRHAVKNVYYPKYSPSKPFYDAFRNPNGGYGGLFSVTFFSTAAAAAFFDCLEVLKGPSLGTNFTLGYVWIYCGYCSLDAHD